MGGREYSIAVEIRQFWRCSIFLIRVKTTGERAGRPICVTFAAVKRRLVAQRK